MPRLTRSKLVAALTGALGAFVAVAVASGLFITAHLVLEGCIPKHTGGWQATALTGYSELTVLGAILAAAAAGGVVAGLLSGGRALAGGAVVGTAMAFAGVGLLYRARDLLHIAAVFYACLFAALAGAALGVRLRPQYQNAIATKRFGLLGLAVRFLVVAFGAISTGLVASEASTCGSRSAWTGWCVPAALLLYATSLMVLNHVRRF